MAGPPDTVTGLLIDWLEDMQRGIATLLDRTDESSLHWRPHPDANNISVTVWHVARWLDVVARSWASDDHLDEDWWRQGWADRTGYDPAGLGFLGLGAITGYTPEQARDVPPMEPEALLSYLRGCVQRLTDLLDAAAPEELAEPTVGLGGSRSRYAWLKTVMQGGFGHVGEIEALLAAHERSRAEV